VFYTISARNFSAAVVASDGVVVRTTPNFRWGCGQRVAEVLDWAEERGMCCSASDVVPSQLDLVPRRESR